MKVKSILSVVCLAIAMASSIILVSCGKEEVLTEPEKPTEPTETTSYTGIVAKFEFKTPASGDIAGFRKYITDELTRIFPKLHQVDELTYSIGTQYSTQDKDAAAAFEKQYEACKSLVMSFSVRYQNNIEGVPIYIGSIHLERKDGSVNKDWDGTSFISLTNELASIIPIKTPNMTNTHWITSVTSADVQSIKFDEETINKTNASVSAKITINETIYSSTRLGENIEVFEEGSTDAKYIFELSDFGKKLSLIKKDGQDIAPAIVYTRQEAQDGKQ